jgi:hypothetical protein
VKNQYLVEDIIKDTGMDEIDWIKAIYNKYQDKGKKFKIYVSEKRFLEIINCLQYYGSYHFDLMGYLLLTHIKIEKTKGKEKIVCYK